MVSRCPKAQLYLSAHALGTRNDIKNMQWHSLVTSYSEWIPASLVHVSAKLPACFKLWENKAIRVLSLNTIYFYLGFIVMNKSCLQLPLCTFGGSSIWLLLSILAFSQLFQLGQWGGLCRSNKTRVTAAGRSEIATHITAYYCLSCIYSSMLFITTGSQGKPPFAIKFTLGKARL